MEAEELQKQEIKHLLLTVLLATVLVALLGHFNQEGLSTLQI